MNRILHLLFLTKNFEICKFISTFRHSVWRSVCSLAHITKIVWKSSEDSFNLNLILLAFPMLFLNCARFSQCSEFLSYILPLFFRVSLFFFRQNFEFDVLIIVACCIFSTILITLRVYVLFIMGDFVTNAVSWVVGANFDSLRVLWRTTHIAVFQMISATATNYALHYQYIKQPSANILTNLPPLIWVPYHRQNSTDLALVRIGFCISIIKQLFLQNIENSKDKFCRELSIHSFYGHRKYVGILSYR